MIREKEEDMKIKKLIKYYLLGESIKEIELNRILDKIGSGKKLTKKEISFLNLYQETREENMKDFMYLSKNSTFSKIEDLLKGGKKVICDLHDRNGKFGMAITRVENDFEEEDCVVFMKGGDTHRLEDKFLYNIIYNEKRDEYSLQEQDEYYEKIEAKSDDD
jgi:hypothetical protein